MNTTPTLGLCQWDASDRVLRENFNSDNVKIDAAIAAISPFVKLKEIVTANTENISQIDLDVSDVNWGEWQYVYLDLLLPGHGYVKLQINGDTNESNYSSSNDGSLCGLLSVGPEYGHSRLMFLTYQMPERRITTYTYGGEDGSHLSSVFSNLQTLNLVASHSSYYISPGGKLILWGVK